MVKRYVTDWARGDFGRDVRAARPSLEAPHVRGQLRVRLPGAPPTTATLIRVRARPGQRPERARRSVSAGDRHHEDLRDAARTLEVPFTGSGSGARVHFSGTLLFPGLRAGEHLRRHVSLAARGNILARDGTPLARGPEPHLADPERRRGDRRHARVRSPPRRPASYAAQGYPASAQVGLDGLERIFQQRLAGTPGGSCSPGRACWRQSAAGARPVGDDDDRPDDRDRGDRRDGQQPGRDHRDRPAQRAGAGAVRDRVLGALSRPARR